MLTVRYMSFNYDMDAYIENLKAGAPPGFWAGEGDNWNMISYLAGGSVALVKWESFRIEGKVQVGTTQILSKSLRVEGTGYRSSYKYEVFAEDQPGSAFTYATGLILRAQMKRGFSFVSNIDFFGTSPDLVQEGTVLLVGNPTTKYSTPFNQPIHAILLSAGFTFKL